MDLKVYVQLLKMTIQSAKTRVNSRRFRLRHRLGEGRGLERRGTN